LRQRNRLFVRSSTAAAVGALILAGPAVASGPSGTAAGDAISPQAQPSASCDITVPGGVKAVVSDSGGQRGVQLTDPKAAQGGLFGIDTGAGRLLLPAAALKSVESGKTDLAQYNTDTLAARQCGLPAPHLAAHKTRGDYQLGRLAINTVDSAGKPSYAVVVLTNLDDQTEARTILSTSAADPTRIALPLGHYSAVLVDTPGADGAYHLVVNPDFTVTDGASLTLDERTATVAATTPTTPRPSVLETSSLSITTGDTGRHADDAALDLIDFAGNRPAPVSYLLNPTAPTRHGRFGIYPSFEFDSPATAKEPYHYHITEPYDHVPSSFPTAVDPAGLATVTRHYDNPTGGDSVALSVNAAAMAQDASNGDGMIGLRGYSLVPLGTTRTEYFTAGSGLYWTTAIGADAYVRDLQYTSLRAYRPGEHTSETYFAEPEHPGVQLARDGQSVLCAACSGSDDLQFNIYPFSSAAGTTAGIDPLLDGESEPISMEVRRDGALLGSADFGAQAAGVTVPKGRATYQLTEHAARDLTTLPLSTSSSTTWTFTADPGHGPHVPADLTCVDGGSACSPLPLLFADYSAADATSSDSLAAGRHTLSLSVAHQQDAAAPAVSGATASVSYDDGATWVPAPVSGRDGRYSAAFSVPTDGNGYVALRVSAWDKAGNRIDQTVLRAYRVG
jgi:hypothetical protein